MFLIVIPFSVNFNLEENAEASTPSSDAINLATGEPSFFEDSIDTPLGKRLTEFSIPPIRSFLIKRLSFVESESRNSKFPVIGLLGCVPLNGISFEFVLSSHPNVPSGLATIFLVNSLSLVHQACNKRKR